MHGSPGIAVTSMILAAVAWTLRVAPFAVAAVIFARAAARSGMRLAVGAGGVAPAGLFCRCVGRGLSNADPRAGQRAIHHRFGLPPGPIQVIQFSVPLAIAIGRLAEPPRRDSRRPVMAA